jgi:hypothetical protein
MSMYEDVFEEEADVSLMEELPQPTDLTPPSNPTEVEPMISQNSLTSFSSTQTLNLIGYIKHWKVIILVDSGISQEANFYICVVNSFQS